MDIIDKTKEELIIELQELKQENSELKALIENRSEEFSANKDFTLQNEDITDVSLLRQKAEKQLKNRQPESNKNLSEADLLKLIHELQVHQIELELQNEELLLAKEQEEFARGKYTRIFDFAPSAYFTLTDSGNIAELNLAGAQMLGKERRKLINSRLTLFMSSSSRVVFDDFLTQVISRSSPASCEVTFGTEEESCINALLKGTLSDDGKQCLITAADITERNKRELELRKTAELNYLLVALFANAPALTDKQLYDEALDIAVKITGSAIGFFHQVSDDQQELILTTWNDEARKNCTTVYDNHYPIEKAGNWADCIRQKKPVVYNDYAGSPNRKGMPAGHAPVGRTMSVPVVHEEKVRLIFGVGNKTSDYTDSDVTFIQSIANELDKILGKRAIERNLQQIEDRWHFAIEGSNDGIWDWNVLTGDVYFSNRWKEMIGFEPHEIGEKIEEWEKRVHPDDWPMVKETLYRHFNGETSQYFTEHRILCKDFSWKWIQDRGKVLQRTSGGKPVRIVGTHTDITERKQAEELMRRKEYDLRESQRIAHVGSWRLDVATNEVIWTEELYNMYGFDPSIPPPPYTEHMKLFTTESWEMLSTALERTRDTGIPYTLELETLRKDGSNGWMWVRGEADVDSAGNTVALWGAAQDITELKNAFNEINKAKELLELKVKERTKDLSEINAFQKAILDNAPFAIFTLDTNGIYQSINPAGEAMTGYTADEVIGKMTPLGFHVRDEIFRFCTEVTGNPDPNEEDAFAAALEAIFNKTTDWHWIRKNGESYPVKISHSPLMSADGIVNGHMGLVLDISNEKEYLNSLQESEERFHKMFQEHAAIMLLINPENGDIVQANDTAVAYYGLDFINTTINIGEINVLSPSKIKEEMEMAARQHRNYFIFPHKLANGEIRMVEVHSTPIEVNGNTVLFSIIHDITERKQAENALMKSEAENRAIIQAVPDIMFRIHRDGTCLDSHSQNESSLYVPKVNFVGKKITDVLPPDLAGKSMIAIDDAFTTGKVIQYEYMLSIQGKDRYFENRMIAISDKEVLSIIRDITDRKIAENELQEALRKLSTLIRNLQAGTLLENESRKISLVNQSFCNIFNIQDSPEQLEGNDCVLASSESKQLMKDPEGFIRQIDKILSKGEIVVNDELYLLDGRVLERDYIPIKNNNTLIGHFWQYRDITNRKKSEIALKMQSAAFESFALSIIITDVAGYIQWVNSAFTKLTGYSVDEAVGKKPGDLVKSGKHDKDFFIGFWETLLRKEVWSGELINRKKDGSLYYEEQTITPVLDSQGNISNFIAIKIDITERKKLFQSLADEKRRLADIVKGTNAGTWEWNIQTGETIFNDQWAQMLGYTLEDLAPVSIETWMEFAHPDDLKISDELLGKHFKGDFDYYSFESRMKHQNGEWIWVLDKGRVHEWDTDGKPLLMSGIHLDITEQKRIETALEHAKDEAEKANVAKTEFLSRMSHELRTPMNSILGFAQLMEMGELNPKQKKGVTHILNNGKHLLDLINEVLDIAGIEAGRQMLMLEPVQLSNSINEIVDSIQVVTGKRKISIEFSDSPANNLFVMADKLRLKQVLINLFGNAVKYNKDGGSITIQTRLQPGNKLGNAFIRISITDTGVGITPEDAGKLFQPFERIGAEKTETEGTGLGLMIVKKITEAMGGTVGVDSEAGVGSTFWIELPQAGNRNVEKVESISSISHELKDTSVVSTIFYIEDNQSNIELVEEILAEHRPENRLVTTKFGEKAIELAKKHKPGLILLDLDLPDINGIEVLAHLLADEHTKSIPVIIITADAMPYQVDKLMKAGAAGYLTKPLDVVVFLKTIEQYTIF